MKSITRIALAVGLFVTASAALTGTAFAQDPAITVDPATVPAAGSYDVTIEGTGYGDAPATPIIVLLCPVPESGDAADIAAATCDAANPFQFTIATVTGGAFSGTFTFDVPAEGLGIFATEAAQGGVAAGAIITIDPDAALPTTGAESGLLAIVGVSIIAAGAMVVGTSRRR